MSEFHTYTTVDGHDLDFNGVAKTSSIMRYIQTAAQDQLTANGMSYDELKAQGRGFILSRIRLEIDRPLKAYARLKAVSYPCESRGYSFIRCYRLECDGVTVARAISVWALINTEVRSLVRVNDFELGLKTLPPLDMTIGHIRLPEGAVDVGGYGVHYGDVDQNFHMNNTKYPDMYSNYLPLDGKRIKAITITYNNEAQLGEKLRVLRAEQDGLFYFRTVRGDGKINSEAEIELESL